MELILLEGALVSLAILEVLRAFSIEHAVMPITFVFAISSLPVKNSPPTLNSVSKLALVPTSITPPESTTAVPLSSFELSLVDVALLPRPAVNSPSFFFIEPKLSDIEISSGEVELALSLQLSVMELSLNDLMRAFKEANALAMGPVDLSLSDVNNLSIFEELRIVVSRFNSQY